MATATTFDSIVAARTRTALHMLTKPATLALYAAKGGLKADLERIRDSGQRAEALRQEQSGAAAAGGAATQDLVAALSSLQGDYTAIMGVVRAVRYDLAQSGAQSDVLKAVDVILANEAEVSIKVISDGDAAGGSKKRVASPRTSQEAQRAEIARDASALLSLTGIHAALKKRKVDKARLSKLLADAEALSGKLAFRTAAKGAQKRATTVMREAVSAQRQAWGACYSILSAVAGDDHEVAQLLTEASRRKTKRSPKKPS